MVKGVISENRPTGNHPKGCTSDNSFSDTEEGSKEGRSAKVDITEESGEKPGSIYSVEIAVKHNEHREKGADE